MSDMLTYRELMEILEMRPESTLDDNVTIYHPDIGEFYGVTTTEVSGTKDCSVDDADSVLDKGHLFLVANT